MYDLVVTNSKALLAYLGECDMVTSGTLIKYPVTKEDVEGKHVIGELPCNIACWAASYTEIPLNIPYEMGELEPILEDYFRYADKPITYVVTKLYTHPKEWKKND